jgi:hypothetical protein
MRKLTLIVALALIAAGTAGAAAAVRIRNDGGGQIGKYIHRFERLRNAGERVIVDGDCLSACTLVLGIIPDGQLCVTRRARFGFHRAWKPGFLGIPVANQAGTRALWKRYPEKIRRWIAAQGGLSGGLTYLTGAPLQALYPVCR